jgi:hypothetical protein
VAGRHPKEKNNLLSVYQLKWSRITPVPHHLKNRRWLCEKRFSFQQEWRITLLTGDAAARQSPLRSAPMNVLARRIQEAYGVTHLNAPTVAIIWAAEDMGTNEGWEVAKVQLKEINDARNRAGKMPAIPAFGTPLF